MSTYIGTEKISAGKVNVGANNISKIYQGATQIWPVQIPELTYNIEEVYKYTHSNNSLYGPVIKLREGRIVGGFRTTDESKLKLFSIQLNYSVNELNVISLGDTPTSEIDVKRMDDTHVLVVHAENNTGYLKVFEVNYNDGIVEKSSFNLGTFVISPKLQYKYEDVNYYYYIVAYGDTNDTSGYCKIIVINKSNFDFGISSTLKHYTSQYTVGNSITFVDDNNFVLGFSGLDNDGYISTFNTSGNSISKINQSEYQPSFGQTINVSSINRDKTVLNNTEYSGGNIGVLRIFEIDNSYIPISKNSNTYETDNYDYGSMCKINDESVIVAYTIKNVDTGKVSIFKIDVDQNKSVLVDSLIHETDRDRINNISQYHERLYILTYFNSSTSEGIIKILKLT